MTSVRASSTPFLRLAGLTSLVGLASMVACSGGSSGLPPLGEVVVVVDTDLPLSFASRLRIDIWENGTWIDSRDLLRNAVENWPASFSVYSPDPDSGRVATVRLRVYPDGRTRDYHGERFAPRQPVMFAPDERANVEGDDQPRLLRDGIDVTPKFEPIPLATVDRLVRVRAIPGQQAMVHIVLRGECLGTMADVAHDATCIERDGEQVPVVDEVAVPLAPSTASVLGSFPAKRSCTVTPREETFDADGLPLREEEACVPGGLFLFGAPYAEGLIQDEGVGIPSVLSPFLIDKWEVTVARFRRAIRDGFVPRKNDPYLNDQDFVIAPERPDEFDSLRFCTDSTSPRGREDYALTCISPDLAREFCQFSGGDLPTEAEWYFAAVVIDRPEQTAFPWGREEPDCDRAVFGRTTSFSGVCSTYELGPALVDAAPGDSSIGLGLIGMQGGVAEWTRDQYHHLYEGCWYGASLHDPTCDDPAARLQAVGGVSWRDVTASHDARQSWSRTVRTNRVGFRCARSGSVAE